MKLFLAVFGKAGSPFVSDEVARYVKRLKGSASPLEVVELKESKRDDKLKALAEEAELFEKDVFDWVGGSVLGSYFVSNTSSHYDWAMKKLKAHKKLVLGK